MTKEGSISRRGLDALCSKNVRFCPFAASADTIDTRETKRGRGHEQASDVGTGASEKRCYGSSAYSTAGSIESLDRARIGGLTFDQAVAGLERVEREHPTADNATGLGAEERAEQEKVLGERSRFFVALAAIFREQPKTIALAMNKIRAKSPVTPLLVEGLASSSSPVAQSALVDLMNAKGTDPELRNRTILALSRTPRPSDTSIQAFESILKADPFNDQALLGLGTYSRRLRDDGNMTESAAIGDLLLSRLARAGTKTALISVLQAITNSGYDPALPAVVPFMSDEREPVRAAAVRSVQSMRGREVDAVLADHLRDEPSTLVQASALMAAKVREPSEVLTPAVEAVAGAASDAHVRYRAVEVLRSWSARRPDVQATLERVARLDPEARIRALAQAGP